MHYGNGVYFGNSFFKRWTLVFSVLTLAMIISLMLTGYESAFMSVVSLLANIFLISFGIMLLICYSLCYSRGKNMPQTKTIMHFRESLITWSSRLDKEYACKECDSKFFGYMSNYCSICGSKIQTDLITQKNRGKYVYAPFSDCARLLGVSLFITCISAYMCIHSPNDTELLAIFFIVFGFIYLVLFGIMFLAVHYSNDRSDKPHFVEHVKCYGLHYMIFDALPSFCPSCNYVLNITHDPYCTKCGSRMEESKDKNEDES